MSRNAVTVDPSDETTWAFSAADWCTEEGGGVTLSTAVLTPSATVTLLAEGTVAANAKTCEFSATASGSITCTFTMSDGNKRQRTLTITVTNL